MGTSGSTCTQITANAIATDDNPTCMPYEGRLRLVSMIVPVYKHTWQGCCLMIQPIQLQLANRLSAATYAAASSSSSPPNTFTSTPVPTLPRYSC